MINRYVDGEPAAALLERRWFAAFKAASGVRAECEALLESMALTQTAWNRARSRLAELETLRDALGEELEALDEHLEALDEHQERMAREVRSPAMSAA
jgi:chromosome segregation ATPase